MEILYQYANESRGAAWPMFGLEGCLLKYISSARDGARITKKRHYHMDTEIHIVEKGYQIYRFDSAEVRVEAGHFLWISPEVAHVAADEAPKTVKYAICLHTEEESGLASAFHKTNPFVIGKTPDGFLENMRTILDERRRREPYYRTVVESRLMESVVGLFRTMGIATETAEPASYEDRRLTLAKQYIEDNIERSISLSELAAYCYLSGQQLTRIFRQGEGISAAEYVRQKRCQRIERLLAETDLSLFEISERMGFSSEYYFNAFYKKNAGMTPGAYRRYVSEK